MCSQMSAMTDVRAHDAAVQVGVISAVVRGRDGARLTFPRCALQANIDAAVSSNDVSALKAIVDSVVDDSTPASSCSATMKYIASALDRANDATTEAVAAYTLERLRPRLSSLEGADHAMRLVLYRLYWGEQDFLRAATVLSQSRVESERSATAADKADTYVRIAQAYLQADDDVNADRFIKRATEFVYACGRWDLQMRFRYCAAAIKDAQRKFGEAAQRYMELSQLPEDKVDEGELLAMLQKAVTCIILAPAGPQRQRVMGQLYRDSRCAASLPRHLYGLLEKMYKEQFISAADAATFEEGLLPHQKAVSADGTTVFGKAMQEHNMAAAARVYSHILLSSLGTLLGVDAARAEKIAAKMIAEKRLTGAIDQVAGVLSFGPTAAASDDAVLGGWDAQIKEVCAAVNACVEATGKLQASAAAK